MSPKRRPKEPQRIGSLRWRFGLSTWPRFSWKSPLALTTRGLWPPQACIMGRGIGTNLPPADLGCHCPDVDVFAVARDARRSGPGERDGMKTWNLRRLAA